MSLEHEPVVCPYCKNNTVLTDSSVVYGKSYGMIYLCRPCDAYVGVHTHSPTYKPLGTPANAHTRGARNRAHKVFDPLWLHAKDTKDARHIAYKIMQELMNLPAHKAHIAMFTATQCEMLIHLLSDVKQLD